MQMKRLRLQLLLLLGGAATALVRPPPALCTRRAPPSATRTRPRFVTANADAGAVSRVDASGATDDAPPSVFDQATFSAWYAARRPRALQQRVAKAASVIGPLQLRAAQLWALGQLRRDDRLFAR